MSTFLIIGGTGKVGSRLTALLRGGGAEVRVASRSGTDARYDWRDPSTWAPAVAGIDGVFIVGPGSASDWSPLLAEFLSVAHAAGVSRVVLLSARGVEFLTDGAVALAERAVTNGPVPWTILRPAHFSQNFTEAMFVPVDGEIIAPVGDGAEPFIDVLDIAEVAARVLLSGSFENEILALSGPRALSFAEAAAILQGELGRPVRYRQESAESHVERLRAAGTPEGYIVWRMAMLGGISTGEDAYISDGVERVLGRPATPFEHWARREAALQS